VHIDDLPASHYEPPRLTKRYLNAEHAADQWRVLHQHIVGVPAFDHTRPMVDGCSSSADEHLNRVIDEKRRLDAAFLAVGHRPLPGKHKWKIWVRIRLHEELTVTFDLSEARVRQICSEVDVFIDRELDRQGVLLGENARRRVRELGWKSPHRH